MSEAASEEFAPNYEEDDEPEEPPPPSDGAPARARVDEDALEDAKARALEKLGSAKQKQKPSSYRRDDVSDADAGVPRSSYYFEHDDRDAKPRGRGPGRGRGRGPWQDGRDRGGFGGYDDRYGGDRSRGWDDGGRGEGRRPAGDSPRRRFQDEAPQAERGEAKAQRRERRERSRSPKKYRSYMDMPEEKQPVGLRALQSAYGDRGRDRSDRPSRRVDRGPYNQEAVPHGGGHYRHQDQGYGPPSHRREEWGRRDDRWDGGGGRWGESGGEERGGGWGGRGGGREGADRRGGGGGGAEGRWGHDLWKQNDRPPSPPPNQAKEEAWRKKKEAMEAMLRD